MTLAAVVERSDKLIGGSGNTTGWRSETSPTKVLLIVILLGFILIG